MAALTRVRGHPRPRLADLLVPMVRKWDALRACG